MLKRLSLCLAASAYAAAAVHAAAPPAAAPAAAPSAPTRTYLHWLEERSMLHQAQLLARRYSGNSLQWQHPYGQPQPRARREPRLGVVHRLPRLHHRRLTRHLGPRDARRRAAVARLPGDRHPGHSHRADEALRRRAGPRLYALGGRQLRPHQLRDRSRIRHRGAVQVDGRGRAQSRRHRDRRRHPGPHRQGARLPPRRARLRRLSRASITW